MPLSFSIKEKIILASIILLVILIPASSFVIAYRFRAQNNASAALDDRKINFNEPVTKEPTQSAALKDLQKNLGVETATTDNTPPPPVQVSFGPTLNFQLKIEGRPSGDQSSKQLFVGIAAGVPSLKPQYLLTFKVDVPSSGVYTGLSLAGLTQNSTYTAYVKGNAQIATSSAFTVSPTVADLGILNLITGDLNQDNVIDQNDLTVGRAANLTTSSSANWNSGADFNLDGIVNNFDLGYIYKNQGKIGAGSAWYSKTSGNPGVSPSQAVGSASGSPNSGGYWMWLPGF